MGRVPGVVGHPDSVHFMSCLVLHSGVFAFPRYDTMIFGPGTSPGLVPCLGRPTTDLVAPCPTAGDYGAPKAMHFGDRMSRLSVTLFQQEN